MRTSDYTSSMPTRTRANAKFAGFLATAATAAIIVAIPLLGTWYTVDEGERAVVLRNGALTGIAGPGFHGKLPLIDDVETISLREHMTKVQADSYSQDQQPAKIEVTVNFRVRESEVANAYTNFGGIEEISARLIEGRVPQAVRVAFSQFTAQNSISDRARLTNEATTAIREAIGEDNVIEILSSQLSIQFSPEYEDSIEKRMQAEVEVTKVKQNLARELIEAEIKTTQATAIANSNRQIATAKAEATIQNGDAEAKAIDAKGKALRDNPALVELVTAERWDGKLPATMLPGGTVPFLSLNKQPE